MVGGKHAREGLLNHESEDLVHCPGFAKDKLCDLCESLNLTTHSSLFESVLHNTGPAY